MADPRDLISTYRNMVQGLRRSAGPAGALFAPMEMTADVLEQVLRRQQDLETQVRTALAPLEGVYGLARDTPAALRAQAQAFEAASTSFGHAAELMKRQADLLEGTFAALDVPGQVLRSVRSPGDGGEKPAS